MSARYRHHGPVGWRKRYPGDEGRLTFTPEQIAERQALWALEAASRERQAYDYLRLSGQLVTEEEQQ